MSLYLSGQLHVLETWVGRVVVVGTCRRRCSSGQNGLIPFLLPILGGIAFDPLLVVATLCDAR